MKTGVVRVVVQQVLRRAVPNATDPGLIHRSVGLFLDGTAQAVHIADQRDGSAARSEQIA